MVDLFIFKCNIKVRFSFSSSRGKLMLVFFEWVKQRLVEVFLMKLRPGKKRKRLREILCYCDEKMLMLHHNVWRLFANKVHSRLWIWSFSTCLRETFFTVYWKIACTSWCNQCKHFNVLKQSRNSLIPHTVLTLHRNRSDWFPSPTWLLFLWAFGPQT